MLRKISVLWSAPPSPPPSRSPNQVLGQLAWGLGWRDRKTWLQLYTTLVLPHLTYAQCVWAPYTAQDINKLEAVQKRAVEMCTELKGRTYAYI